MLASTLLISEGPKPVTVLLCLGLVMAGPTGPAKCPSSGADVEGRLWWAGLVAAAAIAGNFQGQSGNQRDRKAKRDLSDTADRTGEELKRVQGEKIRGSRDLMSVYT